MHLSDTSRTQHAIVIDYRLRPKKHFLRWTKQTRTCRERYWIRFRFAHLCIYPIKDSSTVHPSTVPLLDRFAIERRHILPFSSTILAKFEMWLHHRPAFAAQHLRGFAWNHDG